MKPRLRVNPSKRVMAYDQMLPVRSTTGVASPLAEHVERRRLKPIAEQRIVITGAISGIGFAIARRAAAQGARCILVAHYADGLQPLVDDIERHGGQAVCVVANTADIDTLRRVTETAQRVFGGFDSWINHTGVSTFNTLDTSAYRRVFEAGFSSVVNGSLEAAGHLDTRCDGYTGAIINLGPARQEAGVSFDAPRMADRYPVAEFTDAFRDELDAAGSPISVSLVRPALGAGYRLGRAGKPRAARPTRCYDPTVVARHVLHCAVEPTRELNIDSQWAHGALPRDTPTVARGTPY